MSRLNIIHCDLKPENILLKDLNRSSIKVIDFGSSCYQSKRVYTYIQSRFYRAPEIILGISYGTSIDMWSFGCILAELYTGAPLFPGESEGEQILCMMEVLGVPPESVLERATRKRLFFEITGSPKLIKNSRGKLRQPGSKSLKEVLKGADRNFVELVGRCLEWDPNFRIQPKEALGHAWITENLTASKAVRNLSSQPHQGLTSRHNKKSSEVFLKLTLQKAYKK